MFTDRPRLKVFDYLGPYRYFLTFCTSDRRHAFVTDEVVAPVLTQILRAANEHAFDVPAYCFMPDHIHLLVEGTSPASDLRRFVKAAKQYSGFDYRRKRGARLWQPSYFDRILRDEDDTWSVARYIIENPLTAGLAETADAYPFLGSATLTRQELLEFVQCSEPWRPCHDVR